jgi:tagatose 6-phosphate kinase
MILTVTANIAIDRTYVIDHLEVGAVHKVTKAYAHTGGKGVNVSRTVASLGGETLVAGLVGADNLDGATQELKTAGLDAALFPVAGPARQTFTVTADDGTTTAFDEAGPTVTQQEWAGFERHIDGLLAGARMVVIAGSLPPGTPEQSLENLCRSANEHGVPVILDARGAAMRAAQNQKPLVAKLNRSELEQTLDRELTTSSDVLEAATALHEAGAQSVIVTLGAEGAIGLNEQGAWRITHPPASGNPIGAGDAFSAALALALLDDDSSFQSALQQGAAAALASLKAPTAGALDPDEMRKVLPTVQIHQIREAAQR